LPHCAFLTLDDPTGFVIDDALAIAPLADLGWQVSELSWRQTEVPWNGFDAIIIRSTWDYQAHSDEFLRVLEAIDRGPARLANSLPLVRWNLSKLYLKELDKNGVPIVPTLWDDAVEAADFAKWFEELGAPELVIKPVVGANGDFAYRVNVDDDHLRLAEIAEHHDGEMFMVQPFMHSVISEGEFSLFFFNEQYSHAILKTPAQGEFRSQEERGSSLAAIKPSDRLLHRAHQAMDEVMGRGEGAAPTKVSERRDAGVGAAPRRESASQGVATPPLYARVDLVRDAHDDFRIMEVELIEPALYLRMDPGAPGRFARAIDEWYESGMA